MADTNPFKPPLKPAPWVILHNAVGPFPVQWFAGRVVLADEYNDGDPAHPERQVTDEQLQRLGDLGAARLATDEEAAAAQAAKDAALAAGQTWTGYYLTEW
jgi:hypothetical protein